MMDTMQDIGPKTLQRSPCKKCKVLLKQKKKLIHRSKIWHFIKEIPGDPHNVYCSICKKSIAINKMKSADIILHVKSQLHRNLATAQSKMALLSTNQKMDKILITFDEVAVYFTSEEWKYLEEGQKALYKNVMMENYQTLLSLGFLNVKPAIISAMEQGQEPYNGGGDQKLKVMGSSKACEAASSNNKEERQSPECTIEVKNDLHPCEEKPLKNNIGKKSVRNLTVEQRLYRRRMQQMYMYNACVCL
ncbi:uncharacterized protein O3C94_023010 isoform 1-T3 [Discoglossus pictus]